MQTNFIKLNKSHRDYICKQLLQKHNLPPSVEHLQEIDFAISHYLNQLSISKKELIYFLERNVNLDKYKQI